MRADFTNVEDRPVPPQPYTIDHHFHTHFESKLGYKRIIYSTNGGGTTESLGERMCVCVCVCVCVCMLCVLLCSCESSKFACPFFNVYVVRFILNQIEALISITVDVSVRFEIIFSKGW
jgi:hypothetical protein